ncbi:hypothetical protein [Erwinia typographi]|nr:hypothetical protein [Erwinia typographi]
MTDERRGVTAGRSASEQSECERARNGEADPCGQMADGATNSPPRKD